MRDIDLELVEAAVARGLITPEDRARVEAIVADSRTSGPGLYAAQVLVRERLITCADLLGLQDARAARLYECPHCQHRHAREQLPADVGERFGCLGCKRQIRLGQRPELSVIEVLVSRDPRDLAVPLRTSQSEIDNRLASDLAQLDLDRYEVLGELGSGG